MNLTSHKWLCPVLALLTLPGWAMEIQWTRMAGQWPAESSPLVGNFSSNTQPQILVLNRGGQLLYWSLDGKEIGAGQDGAVAQLPKGQWTTTPTPLASAGSTRFVAASVEGLVVGLSADFQTLWQRQLPGQTAWGRALPAVLRGGADRVLVFNDTSGTATCLSSDGQIAWTNAFRTGPSKAPAQAFSPQSGEELVLVPAGSNLFCCDAKGDVRWQTELDGEIVTRPEILTFSNSQMILCGTASGILVAMDARGKIVWQLATDETFSNWIRILPLKGGKPLILFTGLWGNLHAIDTDGRRVWTHHFRAKTRAAPLVLDADQNGEPEIYVPTFHQHLYVFDKDGRLKDDARLSGILPSALVPVTDAASGRQDLLVTTTTLLAYRLRAAPPRSPYGQSPEPRAVTMHAPTAQEVGEPPLLLVRNPRGGLINVQMAFTDEQGVPHRVGQLTSRTVFPMPIPDFAMNGKWSVQATVSSAAGELMQEASWTLPLPSPQPTPPPPGTLRAWATSPHGSFSDIQLTPVSNEASSDGAMAIAVESLYLDEADQAAFFVASTYSEPVRARVLLSRLARTDGTVFGGNTSLHEVVLTGSVNGERVPDALPALGEAGLLTLPPQRAAKVWLNVDAHGALPGNYTGTLSVAALDLSTNRLELPVRIEVLNLRLPTSFPLTLCTWDYVPNRWFPSRSKEVLDDMSRHGANVFPRSTIPSGRVDAAGKLTMDWAALDAELDRLQGRGKILFHLHHPPIEFATNLTVEAKRASELEYIRAFRDHLRERGWSYPDYAFYLLDEPGLDYGTNIHVLLEAGQLIREADPKLLTYTDPVPGLSWKDYERIEPLVDVWAPNMRLVSGLLSGDPRSARILKQKTVWSYECVSQVKSLSPLRYNRANAWRAKFFGLSGIGFWTHSTTEVDHWLPGKTINDEYALVYPGDLPVPSVRWEAVRDGLEDVAAMVLLENQIRRHWDAGTKNELVRQAEETLSRALRDVMELSDEAFVESRDFLRAGDRVLGHTWADVEMFRHHRAAIAEMTLALQTE